jgi:hypothetical protein
MTKQANKANVKADPATVIVARFPDGKCRTGDGVLRNADMSPCSLNVPAARPKADKPAAKAKAAQRSAAKASKPAPATKLTEAQRKLLADYALVMVKDAPAKVQPLLKVARKLRRAEKAARKAA